MTKDDYQFPPFDYFRFGNVFCGSLGPLRWRIEPRPKEQPPVMWAWKWRNGLCFEKREEDCPEKGFALAAEGLDEIAAWLGDV